MGDVVRISKGTFKQDELFDYVEMLDYYKERIRNLEILLIGMVSDRIKSSEAFLISRNQNKKVIDLCHRIVDESNGDIGKIILLLQEVKSKRTDDLPAIEDNSLSDLNYSKRHSK